MSQRFLQVWSIWWNAQDSPLSLAAFEVMTYISDDIYIYVIPPLQSGIKFASVMPLNPVSWSTVTITQHYWNVYLYFGLTIDWFCQIIVRPYIVGVWVMAWLKLTCTCIFLIRLAFFWGSCIYCLTNCGPAGLPETVLYLLLFVAMKLALTSDSTLKNLMMFHHFSVSKWLSKFVDRSPCYLYISLMAFFTWITVLVFSVSLVLRVNCCVLKMKCFSHLV